jgi:hypothetical protein
MGVPTRGQGVRRGRAPRAGASRAVVPAGGAQICQLANFETSWRTPWDLEKISKNFLVSLFMDFGRFCMGFFVSENEKVHFYIQTGFPSRAKTALQCLLANVLSRIGRWIYKRGAWSTF